MAEAAHEAPHLSIAASVGKRNQRMALWALRGIVYSFGTNAAVLVQPLGSEVDGRGSGRNSGITGNNVLPHGISGCGGCRSLAAS